MPRQHGEERRPEDQPDQESGICPPAFARPCQPGDQPADPGDAAVEQQQHRG
jgi:hypothetical protein